MHPENRSTRHRTVRRAVAPLAVAVLSATAWVAIPKASADSSTSFTSTSEGFGHPRGLDFTASGLVSWKGIGKFAVELANDPNATVVEPPANGELVMNNVSSGVYTSTDEDKVFVVAKGHYHFKYFTLPDGTPVPDLSQDVKLEVDGTIVGGTGRFANATGSYTEP